MSDKEESKKVVFTKDEELAIVNMCSCKRMSLPHAKAAIMLKRAKETEDKKLITAAKKIFDDTKGPSEERAAEGMRIDNEAKIGRLRKEADKLEARQIITNKTPMFVPAPAPAPEK